MTDVKFEIVDTGDEEVQEIRLNGEYLMRLNHDEHGWAGMETARDLCEKIAKKLGGTVESVDYTHEDEDDD